MSVPSVAAADTPDPGAGISVGDTHIDLYGDPGNLDVTVTDATAADAYVRLELSGTGVNHLRITDDAGAVLPIAISADENPTLTFGEADTDRNGIPGAPLPAGTTHLHVSAEAPISSPIHVTAEVLNGANGTMIAHSGPYANGEIVVSEPVVSATWFAPDGTQVPAGSPATIATGSARATTAMVETEHGFAVAGGTQTRLTLHAGTIAASGYTAEQLVAGLHVGYSPNASSYASKAWTMDPDGSLSVEFPVSHWLRDGTGVEYFQVTADWGLPAGQLPVHLQTISSDGRPYAESLTVLNLTADSVPADRRAAFYGRDSAGVLWQYQATADVAAPGRYSARAKVGGGWDTYTAISPLGSLTSAGTGGLVARDHDGVLWYYQGTGNPSAPFARRTRVGPGWNTYTTLISAGDVNGDGHPDLLAVDHDGKLWYYQGTGNPAAPYQRRVQAGTGWSAYTRIAGIGDMTGDGHPDLLAVDRDGKLWYYQGTGNPAAPFARRVQNGTGWNIYDDLI